jgi:transposase
MKPYSPEFRRDILSACDSGDGTRAVALRFGVSESWVRRVKQERRETGKVAPSRIRRRTPEWAALTDPIRAAIAEKPDRTLGELKAHLGTGLSIQTLSRALLKLGLTVKKKS